MKIKLNPASIILEAESQSEEDYLKEFEESIEFPQFRKSKESGKKKPFEPAKLIIRK